MTSNAIVETYSAVTSTDMNSLYFDGLDEGMELQGPNGRKYLVLLDNVITTGGTFRALSKLLLRYYPGVTIKEAVVMFTEGENAFTSFQVSESLTVPIVALGGHIPIIRTTAATQKPDDAPKDITPVFNFKSSARFPTYYCADRNIEFNVFEDVKGTPAVAVVAPDTWKEAKVCPTDPKKWSEINIRVHDACITVRVHSVSR